MTDEYIKIVVTCSIGLVGCKVQRTMKEFRADWESMTQKDQWNAVAEFAAENQMYDLSWEAKNA